CPGGVIACFHTHPLEDFGGGALAHTAIPETYRLGFGPGDYAPLLQGEPNYMLNFQRALQVLEYTPSTGYTVSTLNPTERARTLSVVSKPFLAMMCLARSGVESGPSSSAARHSAAISPYLKVRNRLT
ncbi:MAG: hypothetical protein ACRD3J_16600, partial [Thermoanaerobaculia bacterium]